MKLTKKNTIITLSALVVTSIAIFIIVRRSNNKRKIQLINDVLDGKEKDPNTGAGQKVILQAELNKLPIGNFPLKFGDKNQKVAALQQAINKAYGTSVDIDGIFGKGLYNILCDKYFNYGCSIITGAALGSNRFSYPRTITAQNFEEIKNLRN